jgi:regulator of protease activity HflC (stomatin/prohibitin superfamily)
MLMFTVVKEGTAKAVVRMGGFHKIIMAWKGFELDEEWNVKPVEEVGKKLHLPGGLRFVGIWPLDKVYTYKFRWRGIEIVEAREKVEFREKTIDYILVKPDVYWTKIEAAETAPPERIPLDIEFLVTARVINPYKALFKAPPNWLENLLSRLNALFRDWVATKTLDEILAIRKEPEKIWEELGKADLIQKTFKEEWGILTEGIQIRDVKLPPEYAEAAAYERRKALEAAGRAEEIIGTFVEGVARALGKKKGEIQKMIFANPKKFIDKYKEIIEMVWSGIINKLSMEERAYLRIETPGATGALGDLLRLIGAWQRMPRGREEKREKGRPEIDKRIEEAKRTYKEGQTFKTLKKG